MGIDISKDQLSTAISESASIKEVMQSLGWKVNNGNYRQLQHVANQYELALPVYDPRSADVVKPKRKTLSDDEFFAMGVLRSGSWLRERMIRLGIKYTCSNIQCVLHNEQTWNGVKLVFQVDHINGNRFDNRIDNLRFLCPNCHSQTTTYGNTNANRYGYCECGIRKYNDDEECVHFPNCADCGKKCKDRNATRCAKCEITYRQESGIGVKFDYPPTNEMISRIEDIGYLAYGKELGISDNAIRKHFRRENVNPLPKRLSKKEKSGI